MSQALGVSRNIGMPSKSITKDDVTDASEAIREWFRAGSSSLVGVSSTVSERCFIESRLVQRRFIENCFTESPAPLWRPGAELGPAHERYRRETRTTNVHNRRGREMSTSDVVESSQVMKMQRAVS